MTAKELSVFKEALERTWKKGIIENDSTALSRHYLLVSMLHDMGYEVERDRIYKNNKEC